MKGSTYLEKLNIRTDTVNMHGLCIQGLVTTASSHGYSGIQ